ncbi:amino acid carrier protein [Megasphaera paucivorans]|uniref:Alanine or glycine:cation symporter, AGCS family n=1 Tax=Megasphaera paucivorans TaxID=349095 RepID=A0A1H0BFS2_9FIRM|nr:amino acid carrier protein [Megasphaera paucivorans]SDN44471.1 alanine or glycine:cation symporter, AGCS family [Megasphaera paucivorans]
MKEIFDSINSVLAFVAAVSDFFWDFPTNIAWYKAIPVLGNFSLAVIVLVGSGIYFSSRLGFIQVTQFKRGIKLLVQRRTAETGISPLAAFFLSSAMRVGPGNIIGVTGAISVGGPGALFWMWISAFFGMATAYMESTLAQIFKEKKNDEFVGGLPFYGRRLLGNKVWVGIALSCVYILYAMFCLPAQAFNVVSSVGAMGEIITGTQIPTISTFYYITAVVILLICAAMAFGGIKRVSKATDAMVPVMAVVYVVTVLALIVMNVDSVPYFFSAVFGGAFKPEAIFGGLFGVALVQGVKRGLMSNEAGQGTITMAAAAADAKHPCEQGLVASLGVLLDTHIICTMTGFIIIMAHAWAQDPTAWKAAGKLPKFLMSANTLAPGFGNALIMFLLTFCFCLFAYTTMVGLITYSEIAANRISRNTLFINAVRSFGIFVAAFGIMVNIAGYDLGNLWAFSDLANITIVYINIPLLYMGAKYVFRATKHYTQDDGTSFDSRVVGVSCEYWDKK